MKSAKIPWKKLGRKDAKKLYWKLTYIDKYKDNAPVLWEKIQLTVETLKKQYHL